MFGVKEFTAIINPPQCAIMAVGSGSLEVHPDTGKGYTAMRSTLSFDRRFIDEQLFHGNLPEGGGESTVYEFRACSTHAQGNSCRALIK